MGVGLNWIFGLNFWVSERGAGGSFCFLVGFGDGEEKGREGKREKRRTFRIGSGYPLDIHGLVYTLVGCKYIEIY